MHDHMRATWLGLRVPSRQNDENQELNRMTETYHLHWIASNAQVSISLSQSLTMK
jgi:hypothetical protein